MKLRNSKTESSISEKYSFLEGKDIRARVIKAYLEYAKIYHPEISVKKICEEANVQESRIFVTDDWLTAREAFTISRALLRETGDSDLSRNVGKFAVSQQYLGTVPFIAIKHLLSLSGTFKNFGNLMRQFNRFLKVNIERKGFLKTTMMFSVSIKPDALSSPLKPQLEENFYEVVKNMIGYIEGIPLIKSKLSRQVKIETQDRGNYQYQIKVHYYEPRYLFLAGSFIAFIGWFYISGFSGLLQAMDSIKNITKLETISGLLVLSNLFCLHLFYKLKRTKQVLELDGVLGDLNFEKQESLESALKILGRAMPKDMLYLAGVDSLKQIKPGKSQMQELTIMFLDLKDFTKISDQLGPEHTVRWLNLFYSGANKIIKSHSGAVSKFIGDSVLSFFPSRPEFAIDATKAILELADNLNKMNKYQNHYYPRFGINTGKVNIGILGDDSYYEVTGISESVNTAARLEQMNRALGSQTLISDEVYKGMSSEFKNSEASHFRYVGEYTLRGQSNKTKTFSFNPRNELSEIDRSDFESIITLVDNDQQSSAIVKLKEWCLRHPEDTIAENILLRITLPEKRKSVA